MVFEFLLLLLVLRGEKKESGLERGYGESDKAGFMMWVIENNYGVVYGIRRIQCYECSIVKII